MPNKGKKTNDLDDMTELERLDAKVDKLLNKMDNVQKDIKKISELERSINFISGEFEEIKRELRELKDDLKKERAENRKLAEAMNKQASELVELKKSIEYLLAKEKSCNAEIKGVKVADKESVREICIQIAGKIGLKVLDKDIKDAYKYKIKSSQEEIICVKFFDENLRNEFIYKGKKARLTLSDIGRGSKNPIYVNEDLTQATRKLFAEALAFKRKSNYSFCWIKRGKVYLRKSQDSAVVVVNGLDDIKDK